MTVSSILNRTSQNGNGATTTIPITFPFRSAADLVVLDVVIATGVQTTLTLTTHYTITGTPDALGYYSNGGNVEMVTAPAGTKRTVVYRDPAQTQALDLGENDSLPAENVEAQLDYVTMLLQRVSDLIGRSARQPDGDASAIGTLPSSVDRASMYFAFDTNGDPVATAGTTSAYVVTPFMETVLDDTTAAAARTTMDASKTEPADNVFRVVGSADATKKVAFEVDGLTTATTRTVTLPNQDLVWSASWPGIQDFRLSLFNGAAVSTADVNAAGTLYCVPYKGNRIALWDGAAWVLRNSSQFSLALTLTSGKPYDIFCYDNAGVPTLEVLVWTNDTTRATALAYQDGVLVKSGAPTRRYLGSLYASAANVTDDSLLKRYLWNYYHRVLRHMRAVDTTDTWTYTTSAYRQANANAANQFDFVLGLPEDTVEASVYAIAGNTTGGVGRAVNIGLDSTSLPSAQIVQGAVTEGVNEDSALSAHFIAHVASGRHALAWLEVSTAAGTTTWVGDNAGGNGMQTGLFGRIWS